MRRGRALGTQVSFGSPVRAFETCALNGVPTRTPVRRHRQLRAGLVRKHVVVRQTGPPAPAASKAETSR